MNQQKIGKFIQERRKEKELTQAQLAEKLGVSNRTISKWENGNSLPDYSMFNDLCSELDISINELLSGEKLTEENYQEKFENNFVNTIEYNNKMRNKKIRKLIFILMFIVVVYLLYKWFVLWYYGPHNDIYDDQFPYNDNISYLDISGNGLANKKFDSNWFNIYVPEGFNLVTDKAKSGLVMDNCDLYANDLKVKDDFEAAVLICNRFGDSVYNLDSFGINSTMFPFFDPYRVIEKYDINDTVDLLKYHEKHYNDDINIFTSTKRMQMNYIARNYSEFMLPSYSKFYYLEGSLRGYLIVSNGDYAKYQVYLIFGDNAYSVTLFNRNNEYFDYDKMIEIISSIYSI